MELPTLPRPRKLASLYAIAHTGAFIVLFRFVRV